MAQIVGIKNTSLSLSSRYLTLSSETKKVVVSPKNLPCRLSFVVPRNSLTCTHAVRPSSSYVRYLFSVVDFDGTLRKVKASDFNNRINYKIKPQKQIAESECSKCSPSPGQFRNGALLKLKVLYCNLQHNYFNLQQHQQQ